MTDRPGFMLYFELSPALETLEDAAAGRLLKALMAYAQHGEVRDLTGTESFAFMMMRGRMDRDAEAYREKCRKSAYSAYVREARRRGGVPLTYGDWLSFDIDRCRTMSDDVERYPTITTTTDPTTEPTPDADASPNTSPNTKSILISNTSPIAAPYPNAAPASNAAPDPDRRSDTAQTQSSDTGWVLDYLNQRDRNRQAKGGTK